MYTNTYKMSIKCDLFENQNKRKNNTRKLYTQPIVSELEKYYSYNHFVEYVCSRLRMRRCHVSMSVNSFFLLLLCSLPFFVFYVFYFFFCSCCCCCCLRWMVHSGDGCFSFFCVLSVTFAVCWFGWHEKEKRSTRRRNDRR